MTGTELVGKTLQRVGDDPALDASSQYYTAAEALAALNRAHRLFVLRSLCLETTASLAITAAPFYHVLQFFPDFIVPLRVRLSGGAKLKPSRLADLAALDRNWTQHAGTPTRYSFSGFDLLGVYKQASGTLRVQYARSPVVFTGATSPEINEEFHPALIDGAIPLLRIKEGEQEFQKTTPYWDRYMQEADRCARSITKRNQEQGLDRIPVEIRRYDMSAATKKVS